MLSPSDVPDAEDVTFLDSQSFSCPNDRQNCLHSPVGVREPASLKGLENPHNDWPVILQFSKVVIEYGNYITRGEGQCLWAIRNLLHEGVPVPEVYGWCRDKKEAIVYVQRTPAVTLEERWDSMTIDERMSMGKQLSAIMVALPRPEQDPDDQLIGKNPSCQ